jgi:hypothetical protein
LQVTLRGCSLCLLSEDRADRVSALPMLVAEMSVNRNALEVVVDAGRRTG